MNYKKKQGWVAQKTSSSLGGNLKEKMIARGDR